jgi:pimeloyl-ACP methyl ester carboxylesterase
MAPLILDSKVVKSQDGIEIFAEACGDHSKPHVVFVHGLACTATAFDTLFSIPELQKNLYLVGHVGFFQRFHHLYIVIQVRYETRGHGRSGKPESEEFYESKRYAEDFAAVYEAFQLKKPFYAGWQVL